MFTFLFIVQAAANIIMTTIHDSFWDFRYLVTGGAMLLFAILDWKTFKFYPLEADIFIDGAGRNKEDLALF